MITTKLVLPALRLAKPFDVLAAARIHTSTVELAPPTKWVIVLLSTLAMIPAMAFSQTSVTSAGVNCVQPQAVGDGQADDTAALQSALDMASTAWRAVCLQPGRYRYTTDLTLPSRVSVYGLSGTFNQGVELLPANGARLVINGSTQTGGWHVRSRVSNLTFRLSSPQSSAIYINRSYHLTFDHVAIYSAQHATIAALSINAVNTFICNFCVIWGNQAAPTGTGVVIGGGGPAVVQMNSPDIEGFDVGISVSGGTQLTMVEPWFEKNRVGYRHNTTFGGGSTRILGGTFSLPNDGTGGVGISVEGDHLLVEGTLFQNLGAAAAYGFALPKPAYADVRLLGIPSISAANAFLPGANMMGVQVDPPPSQRLIPSRVHFTKQVVSGSPTDILSLSSFTQFARFRLVLTAFDGNGFQTNQFDFGVTANVIIGNNDPIVTPLSSYSNANWQLALGSLQFRGSGSSLIVSITATESGALGQGRNPIVVGELEVLSYQPGQARGAINLL